MLRSLYAGVSGMKSFQTKMDVVSNNIANANTPAFKSGRVRFQDMLSQTLSGAQSPVPNGLGGVNPQQVGLGVMVGAIDNIMTGGQLQPTNRDLDLAIEGEGFFAVSQDSAGALKSYTRDGGFYKDYEGNLTTSSGLRVLGYLPVGYADPSDPANVDIFNTTDDPTSGIDTPLPTNTSQQNLGLLKPLSIPKNIYVTDDGGNTIQVEIEDYSINGSGQIIGVYSDGKAYILGQVGVVTFENPTGLEKTGSNNYRYTSNSGAPAAGIAGSGECGTIRPSFLEMSNVDLANEFTEMIITSRAYQANSRTITTSDEMLQELINLKR